MTVFELLSGEQITILDSGEERAFNVALALKDPNISFFVRGARYFIRHVIKVLPPKESVVRASPKRKPGRPRIRFTLG